MWHMLNFIENVCWWNCIPKFACSAATVWWFHTFHADFDMLLLFTFFIVPKLIKYMIISFYSSFSWQPSSTCWHSVEASTNQLSFSPGSAPQLGLEEGVEQGTFLDRLWKKLSGQIFLTLIKTPACKICDLKVIEQNFLSEVLPNGKSWNKFCIFI